MKTTCPSCGAEVGSTAQRGQRVCSVCFHIWQDATQDLRPRSLYQPTRPVILPSELGGPGDGEPDDPTGDMAPGFGESTSHEQTLPELSEEDLAAMVELSRRAALGSPSSRRGGLRDGDLGVIGQYKLAVPERRDSVWGTRKPGAPTTSNAQGPTTIDLLGFVERAERPPAAAAGASARGWEPDLSPDEESEGFTGVSERTLVEREERSESSREATLSDLDALLWTPNARVGDPEASKAPLAESVEASFARPQETTSVQEATALTLAREPTHLDSSGVVGAARELTRLDDADAFFAALDMPAPEPAGPADGGLATPPNPPPAEETRIGSAALDDGDPSLWALEAASPPEPTPPDRGAARLEEPTFTGADEEGMEAPRELTRLDDADEFFAALDSRRFEGSDAGVRATPAMPIGLIGAGPRPPGPGAQRAPSEQPAPEATTMLRVGQSEVGGAGRDPAARMRWESWAGALEPGAAGENAPPAAPARARERPMVGQPTMVDVPLPDPLAEIDADEEQEEAPGRLGAEPDAGPAVDPDADPAGGAGGLEAWAWAEEAPDPFSAGAAHGPPAEAGWEDDLVVPPALGPADPFAAFADSDVGPAGKNPFESHGVAPPSGRPKPPAPAWSSPEAEHRSGSLLAAFDAEDPFGADLAPPPPGSRAEAAPQRPLDPFESGARALGDPSLAGPFGQAGGVEGPFGVAEAPTLDPFASQASGHAALDPFASHGPPTVDPFASHGPPTLDPFASHGPPTLDPFASHAAPGLDPFGVAGGDSDLGRLDSVARAPTQGGFGGSAPPSDPFGSGAQRQDSFAGGPQTLDPFQSGPRVPRGGGDPFEPGAGSRAGGAPADDPFGWSPYEAGGDFGGQADFLAPDGAVQGEQLQGAPPRAPAARSAGPAPRTMEARAPGGPATPGGAEPLFELDMPDAPAAAAPSLGRRTGARPKAKTRRHAPRGTAGPKRPRWLPAALVLGLLCAAGVGLGAFTEYGYFGLNLVTGPVGGPASPSAGPRGGTPGPAEAPGDSGKPAAAPAAQKEPDLLQPDGAKDSMDRVAALQAKLKAQPRDLAAQQDLARTLQRLRERYPAVFTEDPAYAKALDDMLKKPAVADDPLVKVRTLLSDAKTEEALALLEPRVTAGEAGAEELYLSARAHLAKGDPETARKRLEHALERVPDYEAARYDLATLHRAAGRKAEAKQAYERVLVKNDNHVLSLLALAQAAQEAGEAEAAGRHVQSAISAAQANTNREAEFEGYLLAATIRTEPGRQLGALERALELKPRHESTALEVARRLHAEGRHEDALKALKRCQEAGCASPEFFVALVQALRKADRAENAKTQLAEAVRIHATHTALNMLQVDMEMEAKRYAVAKELAQRVIDNDPKHVPAYLRLAEMLANESQLDQALSTLRDGVLHTEAKDRLPLLQRTAELLITQGKTVEAKEVLEKILSIDENQTAIKLRFAALLKQLGYLEESLKLYRELERDHGLDLDGQVKYAQVLHGLGQFDDALAKVQEVFFKDPLNEEANVLRGFVYTSRGEHAAAHNDFQRARKVNEESSGAHWGLGLNELAQGHIQQASEYLTRAVELAPKNLDIRYDLARTLSRLGSPENRREAVKQLSLIIREYDKFETNLERKQKRPEVYLQRGIEWLELAHFQKGLVDIGEAEKLAPERVDIKVAMGEALLRAKSYPEAEAALKSALSTDAYDAGANYFQARVLADTKREGQAVEHLRRSIAADAKRYPDAHRLLGYMARDRGANAEACKSLGTFLDLVAPDNPHRGEVTQLARRVCGKRSDR